MNSFLSGINGGYLGQVIPSPLHKPYSRADHGKLFKLSLVLNLLDFREDDEVVVRLKRLYGNDFNYPLDIETLKHLDLSLLQKRLNC